MWFLDPQKSPLFMHGLHVLQHPLRYCSRTLYANIGVTTSHIPCTHRGKRGRVWSSPNIRSPTTRPHTDTYRYTNAYERRSMRWALIAGNVTGKSNSNNNRCILFCAGLLASYIEFRRARVIIESGFVLCVGQETIPVYVVRRLQQYVQCSIGSRRWASMSGFMCALMVDPRWSTCDFHTVVSCRQLILPSCGDWIVVFDAPLGKAYWAHHYASIMYASRLVEWHSSRSYRCIPGFCGLGALANIHPC